MMKSTTVFRNLLTIMLMAGVSFFSFESNGQRLELNNQETVFKGLDYIMGCHPYSNLSFVSVVGTRSKKVAYGNNRADFSFIASGVVSGLLILEPDFPENHEYWPFFWGENVYVVDIGAELIHLSEVVNDLVTEH